MAKKAPRPAVPQARKGAPRPTPRRSKSAVPPVPIAIDERRFRWSAASLDTDFAGDWDWQLEPQEARCVLEVLADVGDKTWGEVKAMMASSERRRRPLHHAQSILSIDPAARERLRDLKLDIEEVFRLRHGNLRRIWGYVQGDVFNILWYDRSHKVCPSDN